MALAVGPPRRRTANSRTAEQPNSRTAEQPNSRTAEQPNSLYASGAIHWCQQYALATVAKKQPPSEARKQALAVLSEPSQKKSSGAGGARRSEAEIQKEVMVLYEKFANGCSRSDLATFAAQEWGTPRTTFATQHWKRLTAMALEAADRDREDIFSQLLITLGRATQMAAEQRNPSAMQACSSTLARLACVDPSYFPICEDAPRRR